jgi:hypothetical protein
MIVSVLVRRLREGSSYEDFRAAWEPRDGERFDVPVRVLTARRLDDERQLLSVGLVDVPRDGLVAAMERVADADRARHERIEHHLEETAFRGLFELVDDEELGAGPTRDDVVRRLAETSHETWLRQKERDQGVPRDDLPAEPTEHDLERAEDAVAALEELGVLRLG